jgi:hypothetical protein
VDGLNLVLQVVQLASPEDLITVSKRLMHSLRLRIKLSKVYLNANVPRSFTIQKQQERETALNKHLHDRTYLRNLREQAAQVNPVSR